MTFVGYFFPEINEWGDALLMSINQPCVRKNAAFILFICTRLGFLYKVEFDNTD